MRTPGLALVYAFVICLPACKKSKYDSQAEYIHHDGEKRTYLLHVPASYDDSVPVSLIIALHGGTGSAKNLEEQSRLAEYADEQGFIACFPDGLHRTWNAGACCGKAASKNVDDVGFLSKLIDRLLDEYSIDPARVFVTGMSNGAFMAYRLACERSEQVAAIAPVAGSMTVDNCAPSDAVSIIHFHSYLDENIPFEGGVGNGLSDHYNPPVESVLTDWASYNGCSMPDSLVYNGPDFDHWRWTGCADSTEIELYVTHDGGHSWPMGRKGRKNADDPSQSVDANALMWAFFKAHPKK